MSPERTAMLFSPPLPPVRLGTQAPTAIGRHPSCDFPLRRDDVSRRHAEIRREGECFVLHDLGSTNGTYLNGRRIDTPCGLNAGDRIEVGSAVVMFCEIDCDAAPQLMPGDEARTIVFERPSTSSRQAFSGDLAEIPPPALFQLVEMNSNTGVLEISSGDGPARVWFDMGRPIHAATEKNVGFDAAVQLVGIHEGHFRFGPYDDPIETTIQASVTELLLEACRLEDEA